MKKNYSLILFLLLALNVKAQVNFNWVSSLNGSTSQINPPKVATDNNGNIYVVGTFDGTRPFGTYTLTASNPGGTDAYIAKYDNLGNCIWAKNFGYAFGSATGNGVYVDNNGDIFMCGSYNVAIQIDTNTIYGAIGQSDVFFVKLNSNDSVLMSKHAGGQSTENAAGIVTDPQGNIYFTGSFGYKCYFDSDSIATTGLSSLPDVFITKYTAAGNLLWIKKAGGADADGSIGIKYRNNRLYVAGTISSGACTFGSNSVTAVAADGFIAKYDLAGNNMWVKKCGGSVNDFCYDLSTDPFGNAFITGSFVMTATFGTFTLSAGNAADIFIAKYDSMGVCIYAKKAGAPAPKDDIGIGIATDNDGYSYLTGSFAGAASFSPFNLTSAGNSDDVFVARYDPTGVCKFAVKAGNNGADKGTGICWISSTNEFIIVGNYNNSITFSGNTITTPAGTTYATFITRLQGTFTGIDMPNSSVVSNMAFPNPASDIINISSLYLKDAKNISLINAVGQTVFSNNHFNQLSDYSIDVKKLPNGFYTIKIDYNDGIKNMKAQISK